MAKRISRGIFLFYLLFLMLPVLWLVWNSVTSAGNTWVESEQAGLFKYLPAFTFNQFQALFQDRHFLQQYANSLKISSLSLLMQIPVTVTAGFFLSSWKSRFSTRIVTIYFIMLLLPFQAIMLPVYQLSLATKTYNTHTALILFNAFTPLGTAAMYLLFGTIEKEHWEAALLETSSSIKLLYYVLLPQIRTGLAAIAVLLFVDTWNQVEQPLMLLSDSRLMPLSLTLNDIYSVSDGKTFAGALSYSLPIIFVHLIIVIFVLVRKKSSKRDLLDNMTMQIDHNKSSEESITC